MGTYHFSALQYYTPEKMHTLPPDDYKILEKAKWHSLATFYHWKDYSLFHEIYKIGKEVVRGFEEAQDDWPSDSEDSVSNFVLDPSHIEHIATLSRPDYEDSEPYMKNPVFSGLVLLMRHLVSEGYTIRVVTWNH